jgi:subtilisin family serine protease
MKTRRWSGYRKLVPLWVALALFMEPHLSNGAVFDFGPKPAYADDDDDGGDDDGGSSYSSGESDDDDRPSVRRSGPNLFRALTDRFIPRRQRREARPRQREVPLPDRAPDEIVATGVTAPQLAALQAGGFTILERTEVGGLNGEVLRLRIPSGTQLEAARDLVIAAAPQSLADFSHYYRSEQAQDCSGPHCASIGLIDWPGTAGLTTGCGGTVTIGLIDTAINPAHAAFAGGQIEVIRLSDAALPESGKQHGTAIAALLAGAAGTRTPGLLPGAKIIAVDAFYQAGRRDNRSGVYELLRALDLLSERDVRVANMSLAGPPNILLERLVQQLSADGMVIVAAAGNGGPKAAPAYPAAYNDVIAVTAIDRAKRAYRRAGRGEHIDLAAPGVDVWTAASVSGARAKTGTSFATPFVTAAVALLKAANDNDSAADILSALGRSAEDLGEPGKDAVFGWGLINARAACAAAMKKA